MWHVHLCVHALKPFGGTPAWKSHCSFVQFRHLRFPADVFVIEFCDVFLSECVPVIWLHENSGRVTTGFAGQGKIMVILAFVYFQLRIAYVPRVAVAFGGRPFVCQLFWQR